MKSRGEVGDLKALAGQKHQSLLHFAESQWLTENFKGEPAAVWAVLLRDLPKARVGGVLKDLSKTVRRQLKSVDLSKIPPPILKLIQRRAEGRFPTLDQEALKVEPVFSKLSQLDLRSMMKLMRELGITEMALAFSKVNRSATRAILNRLNTRDAKELRVRIKKMGQSEQPGQREAQLHILEMDLEKLSPEEMVQEIGFGVFSRAFGKAEQDLGQFFVYRLPPKQGYVLKRYLDENIPQNTPESVQRTRRRLQQALARVE